MIQNYTTGQIKTNGSLWSLPVEMELYLTFPIVLFIFRKFGYRLLLLFTSVVSFVALISYFYGSFIFINQNFAKYWLLWCSGAVLADFYSLSKLKLPTLLVKLVAFLSLFIAMYGSIKKVDPAILDFFYGISFFVLLWFCLVLEDTFRNKISTLIHRFFSFLGNISFSLYLIHYPFYELCGNIWMKLFLEKPINFLISILFVFLTLPLAWLFYKYVEIPSHIYAKKVAVRFKY